MLIDPGAEVHTFDPTPDDIIKIQNADVFIYIGGENDAWVDQVLESTDTSHMTVLRLMDAITPVEEETVEGMQSEHEHEEDEHEEGEGEPEYDEHIWTSPKNAVRMINYITDALKKTDSLSADKYEKNAAAYTAQIEQVDSDIQAVVDASETKLLVVADRFPFRYLADEFGLNYRAAFSGCSSESEVSAGTLAYLIDTVEEKGIQYVYYIELSNQAVAKAVSEHFEAGITYLQLMQNNLENLKKGLK
jgi:zinc transport system substrate-binding protein